MARLTRLEKKIARSALFRLHRLRYVLAAALPLVLVAWSALPWLQPRPQVIEGDIRPRQFCKLICADLMEVNGSILLGCKHDFSGFPHSCRKSLLALGRAKVTYARFPTVAGVLDLSPAAGVVTSVEHDGEVVFRRSVVGQVWAAVYGGWVFHAIYWPVVALVAWLWPRSRIGRRFRRGHASD